MKKAMLSLALLISEFCFAGEYSDCILENMKGVSDRFAVIQIKKACREKALPYIPTKCKGLPVDPSSKPLDAFDKFIIKKLIESKSTKEVEEFLMGQAQCIDNCLNASYWSKHFGDCKE